jgi:hypothetical protein
MIIIEINMTMNVTKINMTADTFSNRNFGLSVIKNKIEK